MDKTINYKSNGQSDQPHALRDALELVNTYANSLANGRQDFNVSLTKGDGSSMLVIETIAKNERKPDPVVDG